MPSATTVWPALAPPLNRAQILYSGQIISTSLPLPENYEKCAGPTFVAPLGAADGGELGREPGDARLHRPVADVDDLLDELRHAVGVDFSCFLKQSGLW